MLKYKYSILYMILWTAIAAVHFFFLYWIYMLPLWESLADSLVFNILFAIIGSGLWFASPYLDPRKKQFLELISQHVTGIVIALVVWLISGTLILKSIFSDDLVYRQFLHVSQTFRIITGIFYYLVLAAVFNLILTYRELQNRLHWEAQLVAQLKDAELNMLRSQIRPHFLFNSLNSISSLTMTDPEKAQEMIIKLSEFMRYSLSFPDEMMSTLDKELHHIQLYLDIEKVRFGDKLILESDIHEKCLAAKLPAMILQPLIENAVKYGIYEATERSVISIVAICDIGELCNEGTAPDAGMVCETPMLLTLTITNNYDPNGSQKKGTGTGLRNVQKRLETVYNLRNLLTTKTLEDSFITEIKIPQHV